MKQPLTVHDEKLRREFVKWLYNEKYEAADEPDALARAIHRADHLAFHVPETRESRLWPALVVKRGWRGVNPEVLMAVWDAWRAGAMSR